jgi:Ca2+-binding EF-hand superfamily protein
MAITSSASQPSCKYVPSTASVSGDMVRLEALRSELASLLQRDNTRATACFVSMDTDHSGLLSLQEFEKALSTLGLPAHLNDTELVRALFELCDPDGSGTLNYRELAQLLRGGSLQQANRVRAKRVEP